MLPPVTVIERLSVDEHIALTLLAGTYKYEVESIRRDAKLHPVVFINHDGIRERIVVKIWPTLQ